ncbi:MAG TPA: hypothetical protein VIK72_00715 [Clostridiaceae bacterium]
MIEEKHIDELIKSPARFIEKNIIRKKQIELPDLEALELDMKELKVTCKLYQELYDFLCYADENYLFNTSSGSPFNTISIDRQHFLVMILSGKLKFEDTTKLITDSIITIANTSSNYSINTMELMQLLMNSIQEDFLRLQALEKCSNVM